MAQLAALDHRTHLNTQSWLVLQSAECLRQTWVAAFEGAISQLQLSLTACSCSPTSPATDFQSRSAASGRRQSRFAAKAGLWQTTSIAWSLTDICEAKLSDADNLPMDTTHHRSHSRSDFCIGRWMHFVIQAQRHFQPPHIGLGMGCAHGFCSSGFIRHQTGEL